MTEKSMYRLDAKTLRDLYRVGFLGIAKLSKEQVAKIYNKDPEVYNTELNSVIADTYKCMPDIWAHPLEWYFDVDEEDLQIVRDWTKKKLTPSSVVMLVEEGLLNKEQLNKLEEKGLLEKPRLNTVDDLLGAEKVLKPETMKILSEK